MMEKPLVSIALCTYNGERYLKAQLDSILNQTYSRIEVVVVDDHSTDSTFKLLEEYSKKDTRVRLFQNDRNLGFSANFEKAIKKCQGEYIAVADQDDIWEKTKISELLDHIGSHLLIYHDSELVNEYGYSLLLKMSDKINMIEGSDPYPFLFYNCVSGHSLMVRKELIDLAFPLPAYGFHDHWMAFIAATYGSIKYYDRCLVKYRQHGSNVTDILGKKKEESRLERTRGRMERENAWYKACTQVKGHPVGNLAVELHKTGQQRLFKPFNPAYASLLWKKRDKVNAILKPLHRKPTGYFVRQLWGAPLKLLFK